MFNEFENLLRFTEMLDSGRMPEMPFKMTLEFTCEDFDGPFQTSSAETQPELAIDLLAAFLGYTSPGLVKHWLITQGRTEVEPILAAIVFWFSGNGNHGTAEVDAGREQLTAMITEMSERLRQAVAANDDQQSKGA